jgi:hypothetical protein
LVEGGIQARITKPGFDKLLSIIPGLLGSAIGSGICIGKNSLTNGNSIVGINYCGANDCAGGAQGCPAYVFLKSGDRPASTTPSLPPAPGGDDDGKDKIVITVNESNATTKPTVTVDVWLDAMLPLYTDNKINQCRFYVRTDHIKDRTKEPLHVTAKVELNTNAATGELEPKIASVAIPDLAIGIDAKGEGLGNQIACALGSGVFNVVLDTLNIIPFLRDLIINAIVTPALNNAINNLLPKPLGIAGTVDTGSLLGGVGAPKEAGLEVYVAPGGYVQTKGGGLNLGVMTGANSDRDQTTRAAGLGSEPSLCVPLRGVPNLAAPPWNLPFNVARKDYQLNPANEFSGAPDPTDASGKPQDIAIGLSRTFLDLVGYHIYNSGTLCLHIGGAAIPQLNAGTLSIVVQSMTNILEEKTAPLSLVLRPQQPLTFRIGVGTAEDPLINIAVTDARLDLYGWIEQRFVRLVTMAVDINVGLNLTTTMTAEGKPAIQPTLFGIDKEHVTIRVTNTDLLHEMPADLAKAFPSIIDVAAGAIGGAIAPIALPQIAGFGLDGLKIQRVQTSMDDFVAIYANIVAGSGAPLLDWSNPERPSVAGSVRTLARIVKLDVPKQAELRALFAPTPGIEGRRPSVTLALDAGDHHGRPVEWAYRVNGGLWHDWSQNPNPTITDSAFLLQGRHTLEVRSRVVDQWQTEDLVPVSFDLLIDSVPPELAPERAKGETLKFGGSDLVTPPEKLVYAWNDADGKRTAWGAADSISADRALALTDQGTRRFVVYAQDEAGNIGSSEIDLAALGFHGRSTTPGGKGCGCDLGAGSDDGSGARAGFLVLLLVALVRLRLSPMARKRGAGRWAGKAAPLVLVAAVSFFAVGCGCENGKGTAQCKADVDCSKMMCPEGQVPICSGAECGCTPDLLPGDVGRFSSMALIAGSAYISAYNSTYGDLMVGKVTPSGVVSSWDFIDGVPDQAPDLANSKIRGGIMDKGDDVGRYTSIGVSSSNQPIVAYYDGTHGALKFATTGEIKWVSHIVDGSGSGNPMVGDDIGRWASMSVSPDGKPAIAYSAWVMKGISGEPESQLRWAQAKVTNPTSPNDWDVIVLDARLLSSDGSPPGDMAPPPPADMAGVKPPYELLPEGIGIMASAARKADGSPGVAYYDRTRGNLRYTEYDPKTQTWSEPAILDGEDGSGNDLGDVGLYTSLAFDDNGAANITYENATHDSLLYYNSGTKMVEVVDDGYHPADETTMDGLDSPVWHLVGDSSSLQISASRPVVAYQDSTVLELRLAARNSDGTWTKKFVAGHGMPFKGAYGFYANLKMTGAGNGMLSTYAINQRPEAPLFYVEVFPVDLGLIQ